MDTNRVHRIIILATAVAGGLAGVGFFSPAALSQEETPQPIATNSARSTHVEARSALMTAIALGYTEIRGAGLVGDHYQVVTIDAEGNIVRLYMDPQTGVVIKIEAD